MMSALLKDLIKVVKMETAVTVRVEHWRGEELVDTHTVQHIHAIY